MPRSLSPAFIARVEQLKATLDRVYPKSIDAWLEGFACDARPARELWLWERMALTWQGFVEARELSLETQQKVLSVTLSCSLGDSIESMLDGNRGPLRDQDIREIHARYRSVVDTACAVDQVCRQSDQQAP